MWAGYRVQRAFSLVFSRYELVFSLHLTVTAQVRTFGTLLLDMPWRLTTEHLSRAVIRAGHLDIQTAFAIGGGKMISILTDLELCIAAMLFVGAVDLEFSDLPAGLLHENVGEVLAVTVRARLVLDLPFLKAAFAELLCTAVDQVRLTQHFCANRTSQLFSKTGDKLVV